MIPGDINLAEREIINRNGYLTDFFSDRTEYFFDGEVVKMIACGDTGPVRSLEKIVIEKGSFHVLGDIESILNGADFAFANLEAVFSTNGEPLNRVPVFRLNPDAFEIIKDANIKVVSLANNHMFDYGPDAFADTLTILEDNQITHFGAGLTIEQALEPAVVTLKGIKIGFLGFRDKEHKKMDNNGVITPQINNDIVIENIEKLKALVDVLVLSLHFGWEYQFYPSPKDVALCRTFIDNGVDIILGHHPHYPQGVEKYKNGLISYSLGNFIWDQKFVGHSNSSYILEIGMTKKGICSVKIIPFQMNREYQLKIKSDDNSINELNNFSSVLLDKKLLNEKWYFICRDKFLIAIKSFLEVIFKHKFKSYYSKNWLKSLFLPRAVHSWLSLLVFILTLRALKYELKKRVKKKYF